jgi:hypothetical protein
VTGWTPPLFLGRPREFLFTEIDFFIISVYRKCKPVESANFPPALIDERPWPMAFLQSLATGLRKMAGEFEAPSRKEPA